jgi:hypothetical protein
VTNDNPRHARAAEASATIINLYLHADMPKAEAFGRIMLTILMAMHAAAEDLNESRWCPSDN